MSQPRKTLVLLHGEIKTPPFSREARIEAGTLLRRLQEGESLAMPHARPMPSIGARCYAVIIAEVFAKTSQKTPDRVMATCRRRLKQYDEIVNRAKK